MAAEGARETLKHQERGRTPGPALDRATDPPAGLGAASFVAQAIGKARTSRCAIVVAANKTLAIQRTLDIVSDDRNPDSSAKGGRATQKKESGAL